MVVLVYNLREVCCSKGGGKEERELADMRDRRCGLSLSVLRCVVYATVCILSSPTQPAGVRNPASKGASAIHLSLRACMHFNNQRSQQKSGESHSSIAAIIIIIYQPSSISQGCLIGESDPDSAYPGSILRTTPFAAAFATRFRPLGTHAQSTVPNSSTAPSSSSAFSIRSLFAISPPLRFWNPLLIHLKHHCLMHPMTYLESEWMVMSISGRKSSCSALVRACSSAKMMAHSCARCFVALGVEGRRCVQVRRRWYLFVMVTATAARGPVWALRRLLPWV